MFNILKVAIFCIKLRVKCVRCIMYQRTVTDASRMKGRFNFLHYMKCLTAEPIIGNNRDISLYCTLAVLKRNVITKLHLLVTEQ